jgi:hypothetical protein
MEKHGKTWKNMDCFAVRKAFFAKQSRTTPSIFSPLKKFRFSKNGLRKWHFFKNA